MDRSRQAAGGRRWAIGGIAGFVFASLVGAGVAAAATDTKPPVVHAPLVSLQVGSGVGSNAPVRIDFLATDTGTGVPTGYGHNIAISRNGGAYANLTTGMFTGGVVPYPPGVGGQWISAYRSLQLSGTYRIRVRAEDRSGHWSHWVYGPTFRVRMLQENSSTLKYSGGWTRVPGPWMSGFAQTSTTAGATVTGTFTASSLAWVARRAPSHGTAEVWVDGVLAGTVTLNNSNPTVTGRVLVFSRTWPHPGTHKITIHVLGTGLMELDGLLVIR